MPTHSTDERWMRLALSLGARGLGRVWPNPSVGCVIVKDDRVLGRGWTQDGGRPHGEAVALEQAGSGAIGATVYVTLEPCAHQGKTPSCAKRLIDAGITRVVSATTDPDPRVNGKGHAMLRSAGIEVIENMLKDAADTTHLGFFTRVHTQRPMVTLKLANSLDGRIATQTGDSRWISNERSRAMVHILRANHDGVMIGRNTAVADDPDLRVRLGGLQDANPVRVVLDSKLQTPTDRKLAQTAHETPVWMCHGENAQLNQWSATGAKLISCPTDAQGRLDLTATLKQLGAQGLTRVLCEGGGTLAASLLGANLVDRLITFHAGVAVGGDGIASLASLGITTLSEAPRFTLVEHHNLDGDIMSQWRKISATP